jgi:serine protease Do
VVAIGNSLGQYQDTVTSGIVSGLGRPVTAQGGGGDMESLTDLIQTDAAINPGNSGGPLVNLSGQVVGINTAVADANGIGFAIPIDATKGVLKSVLETGQVKKAYLGVRYSDITPALAKSENLPVKKGALVTGGSDNNQPAVVKDGPADKAGLKEGDIIIKINDMKVGEGGNVSSLVSQYVPGTEIEVVYLRDKQEKTTTVTLGEYEEPETVSMPVERQQQRTQPDIYRYLPFGF